MGVSQGLSQLLSLVSQCACWVGVVTFALCLLQQGADGLYLYTVVAAQALLLIGTVLLREVAGTHSLATWSVQSLTDPVLSCLALTPLALVDKLPGIAYTRDCLRHLAEGARTNCLNHTLVRPIGTWANTLVYDGDIRNDRDLGDVLDVQLVVLGLCVMLPPVVGLLHYKPWLPWRHHAVGALFWTLQAVDAASLLQSVTSDPGTHTAVAMSVLARSVLLILTTGFVLSSPLLLVSLLEGGAQGRVDPLAPGEGATATYGRLYTKFTVVLALTLWELPDLGSKALLLAHPHPALLPVSFYCSLVKNLVLIPLLAACVVKLFKVTPKWRSGTRKPRVPAEFARSVEPDNPDSSVVMVDMEGRVTSGVMNDDDVTSDAPNPNWERLVVMYGLVSCLVLVCCMIGAVCLYKF